jgi:hypothetical protein
MSVETSHQRGWPLAVFGLSLTTYAVVALSGPGRIDIVDGQTRFEVGRSLYEHGDSVIRDERIWFAVYPGRDGARYSAYRLPHSCIAAAAIALADATGPVTEGRRHFFFSLASAVPCALLAAGYAVWFRRLGCRPATALLWAAGGVFCTPSWFYGTSTFDDVFGTAAVVLALITAGLTRDRRPLAGAALAGLLLGLAFMLKPPLGAFGLAAVALLDERTAPLRFRLMVAAVVASGLIAGIWGDYAYDRYKFPFDKAVVHATENQKYVPPWADNPFMQLAKITVSLNGGAVWYCPALFLGVYGLGVWWRRGERRRVVALVGSTAIYIGFLCLLSFAKGDLSWGPRYLTPIFGVLWLFAPMGAEVLKRWVVAALLAAGLLVQLLALSVDHHRLYIKRELISGYEVYFPELYFRFDHAHLFMRPAEIVEIACATERAPEFTPAPSPTFSLPVINPPHLPVSGPTALKRYHVLNSFRPWWACMQYLSPPERPVPLGSTAAWLGALATLGLVATALGLGKPAAGGG